MNMDNSPLDSAGCTHLTSDIWDLTFHTHTMYRVIGPLVLILHRSKPSTVYVANQLHVLFV